LPRRTTPLCRSPRLTHDTTSPQQQRQSTHLTHATQPPYNVTVVELSATLHWSVRDERARVVPHVSSRLIAPLARKATRGGGNWEDGRSRSGRLQAVRRWAIVRTGKSYRDVFFVLCGCSLGSSRESGTRVEITQIYEETDQDPELPQRVRWAPGRSDLAGA
jgi:hypothetical protein